MIVVKGKTQAEGSFQVHYPDFSESGIIHTIQFTVRDAAGKVAVPDTGAVEVKVRTPGGGGFESVPNNVVSLNNRDNWLMPPLYPVPVEGLLFTLTDLDGDKTLDVAINASFSGGC